MRTSHLIIIKKNYQHNNNLCTETFKDEYVYYKNMYLSIDNNVNMKLAKISTKTKFAWFKFGSFIYIIPLIKLTA